MTFPGSLGAVLILTGLWALTATGIALYLYRRFRTERVQQSHLQALVDSIPDLTWIKDRQSRFLLVNRQFSRAFDKPVNWFIGKTDLDLSPREQALQYLADDRQVMTANETLLREEEIVGSGGEPAWAETIKVPVLSEQGQVVGTAGMARDITERKEAEARIKFLAEHDPLTGLFNRRRLEDQGAAFLTDSTPGTVAAMVFVDLDNFKSINDTLGHHIGDRALQILSARLETLVDATGWAARFGGDEFVLLLQDEDSPNRLRARAEAIPQLISDAMEVDGFRLEITASIGISLYPQDAGAFGELLRCADLAMYQAKSHGPNRMCYYEASLGASSLFRLSFRQTLQEALQRRDFFLEYQPKVDLETNRLAGLEALLRWQHPEHGLIAPADFIPMAEQTGQIIELGDWVLEQVIAQVADWRRQFSNPPPVAINISPLQLHQPRFFDCVHNLLQRYQVPGKALEFELTESSLMEPGPHVDHCMARLRELDVLISIDDFGTGYSNLGYLSRWPIDVLKIDRTFVQRVDERPDQQLITRAIIQLARSLQMDIVAEGVERAEEVHFLRAESVHVLQGYYFSPSLGGDHLPTLPLWSVP